LVHGESLPAGADGPPMVAEEGVEPADRVEGSGLPHRVAIRPMQVERLLGRRTASTAATYYKVLKIFYRLLEEEEEEIPSPMARSRRRWSPTSLSR
jgi:hypothetical protein